MTTIVAEHRNAKIASFLINASRVSFPPGCAPLLYANWQADERENLDADSRRLARLSGYQEDKSQLVAIAGGGLAEKREVDPVN